MKINQPNTELYDRIGLYELALQMVDKESSNLDAAKPDLLQYLLPINSAYGYYNTNSVFFFDRVYDKTYKEEWESGDEEGRIAAICTINEHLQVYNEFVYDSIIEVGPESELEYPYYPEERKWGLNIILQSPTFDQKEIFGDAPFYNIFVLSRTIDNEFVYKQGLVLQAEEFVLRYNKMMYDYINTLIPKNMPFNEHNIFYKPITEFNNWFMLRGLFVDEVPTLIDDPPADSVEVKKSVHQETEDSISEKQQLTNELRVSHNKVQMQKREIKILKSGFTNNELERAAYLTMKNTGTLNFAKLGRLIGKSDNGARNILKERLPHLYLQHQQKDIYQLDDIDTICPACGNTFDEPPCTCVRK